MPRRAKVIAVSMIVLFAGGSAVLAGGRLGAVIAVAGAVGVAYVLVRVPTRERVLARRA
jgi:hypothetical protein